MRPIYTRTCELTGDWQRLSATRQVMTATLAAPRGNTAPAEVRVEGAAGSHPWAAGISAPLTDVDLSRIEVRGATGDRLLVTSGNACAVVAPHEAAPAGPTLVSAYWQPHSLWLVLNFSEEVEAVGDVDVQVFHDGRLYGVDSVYSSPLSTMFLVMMYDTAAAPGAPDGVIYTPDDISYIRSGEGVSVAAFSAGFSTANKPQPIAAHYRPGDAELEIAFDQPLRGVPGENLPGHEFAVFAYSGPTYRIGFHSGAITNDIAIISNHVSSTPTTEQPPSVTYYSSRPVLFSLVGAPVDPFANFPLTVQYEEGGK